MKSRDYYLNLEYGIAIRNLSEEEVGDILAYYTDLSLSQEIERVWKKPLMM